MLRSLSSLSLITLLFVSCTPTVPDGGVYEQLMPVAEKVELKDGSFTLEGNITFNLNGFDQEAASSFSAVLLDQGGIHNLNLTQAEENEASLRFTIDADLKEEAYELNIDSSGIIIEAGAAAGAAPSAGFASAAGAAAGAAAGLASSFLPQADKATANIAAKSSDFFIDLFPF